MEQPYIKVSFITVNYNGYRHTLNLLDTIFDTTLSFSYEVIVIDNGSNVNEFETLQIEYPEIRGIYHPENLGFAGGNNLGIDLARGEYLYFLNNDTLLPKEAGNQIEAMIKFCSGHPEVGGLSPKIMYNSLPHLIQFAGSTPLSTITIRNKQIGYQERDSGQYNTIKKIPYLHGAAMFVPKKVVAACGKLPTCYFLYYEELDWSCIISRQYQLYYFPKAVIYHLESATTEKDSPLKAYYMSRNRIIFAFRQRHAWYKWFALAYLTFIATPVAFFKHTCKGQTTQMKAVWKGTTSGYKWILNHYK